MGSRTGPEMAAWASALGSGTAHSPLWLALPGLVLPLTLDWNCQAPRARRLGAANPSTACLGSSPPRNLGAQRAWHPQAPPTRCGPGRDLTPRAAFQACYLVSEEPGNQQGAGRLAEHLLQCALLGLQLS